MIERRKNKKIKDEKRNKEERKFFFFIFVQKLTINYPAKIFFKNPSIYQILNIAFSHIYVKSAHKQNIIHLSF